MSKSQNGNENAARPHVDPFKVERDSVGVMHGFMDIAERVMNKQAEVNEAKAATSALDGANKWVKTQLEALKVFEKGSSAKVREGAAKLIGMPASHQQALEDNSIADKKD